MRLNNNLFKNEINFTRLKFLDDSISKMMNSNNINIQKSRFKTERILTVLALGLILGAWILGSIREEADLAPFLTKALPEAERIDYYTNNTYKAFSADDSLMAFITFKTAYGYGGPLKTAVAVNLQGQIIGISLVNDKETPSYMDKVLASPLQESLIGKTYQDPFVLGNDIDGVSGATFSSQALSGSVKNGTRYVAKKYLSFVLPEDNVFSIKFGLLEIILIILFAIGYLIYGKSFKYKKATRWITMLSGLFVLGFLYDQPLTLSYVSQLLLGYFPDFQLHFYWYLLLGGIFLVYTVDNKNPYCHFFCPFGVAQECIGVIGGAKVRPTGRFACFLKWFPRGLALAAILLALFFRNPGISSFEIFGTLFGFIGSNFQFAVLGIILITSLFIKRPWCKYLCPLKPTMDAYSSLRKWVIELWKKKKTRAVA